MFFKRIKVPAAEEATPYEEPVAAKPYLPPSSPVEPYQPASPVEPALAEIKQLPAVVTSPVVADVTEPQQPQTLNAPPEVLPVAEAYTQISSVDQQIVELGPKKRTSFGFKLFLNLLLWGALIGTLLLAQSGSVAVAALGFPSVFLLITYLCCAAQQKEFYPHSWMNEQEVKDVIKRSIDVKPILQTKMECYHIKRERSSSGNHTTTKEVTTWRGTLEPMIKDFVDVSGMLEFTSDHVRSSVLKMHVDHQYAHANEETSNHIRTQREEFIAMNRNRDTHFRVNDIYRVPELPDIVMIKRNRTQKPWVYDSWLYCFCTMITCAFPWAWYVNNKYTQGISYISKKILSITDIDPNQKYNIDKDRNHNLLMV